MSDINRLSKWLQYMANISEPQLFSIEGKPSKLCCRPQTTDRAVYKTSH